MTRVTASLNCNVCLNLESSDNWVVTHPCTHIFHEECIRKWTETKITGERRAKHNTCPLCREKLRRPEGKSTNINKQWSRFGKLHFSDLKIDEGSSSSPNRPVRRKRRISDACGNESRDCGPLQLPAGHTAGLARPMVLADSDAEEEESGIAQAEASESESDQDNARPARIANPARLQDTRGPLGDERNTHQRSVDAQSRLLDEIRAALEAQTRRCDQLSQESTTKDTEIRQLLRAQQSWRETECVLLEGRIAELQNAIKSKDVDIQKQRDDLKSLRKSCTKEIQARGLALDHMNQMNTELTECKIEHAQTKSGLHTLQLKYAELSDNHEELQLRFDRMQRGFNAIQVAHSELELRLERKRKRTAALEQEYESMKAKFADVHSRTNGTNSSTASAAKPRVTSRFFRCETISKISSTTQSEKVVKDSSHSNEESLHVTDHDGLHPEEEDCVLLESTAAQDIDYFDAQIAPPANRHLQPTSASAISKNKQPQTNGGSAKWIAMALQGSKPALGDKKRCKPKFC